MPDTTVADLAAEFCQLDPWRWPSPLDPADEPAVCAALALIRPDLPADGNRVNWRFKADFICALDGGQRLDEDVRGFIVRCWSTALNEKAPRE